MSVTISTISLNNTPNINGWINSPTLVNISATDVSGSGVNIIRWKNSTAGLWMNVSSVFTLSTNLSNHIIYYQSIDNVGNFDFVKQQNFKYDTTNPIITSISTSSNILSSNSSFVLDVYAEDELSGLKNTLTYNIINSSGNSISSGIINYSNGKYSKTLTSPQNNGTYNISVQVYDLADNIATNDSYQITVDNTLPIINVDIVNGSTVGNDTTLSVTFTGLENGWINYTGSQRQNITADGTIQIQISGLDGYFNVFASANNTIAQVSKNYMFTVDATVPTVSIFSPVNLDIVNGSIKIIANVNDSSGIKSVELFIDETLYEIKTDAPYTFYYPTTIINDGLHTIKITAIDNVNMTKSKTITVNVTNNVPVIVSVSGDISGSTALVNSEDFGDTPIYTIVDSITGLNSSNVIATLVEDVLNEPSSEQLSSIIGKINITADTAGISIIHITVPTTVLTNLNLSSPYPTMAFFVDHGHGIVEVDDFGYIDRVIKEGISYGRFWIETYEYSIFFWGPEGEEIVEEEDEEEEIIEDDEEEDSSPGGSSPDRSTTSTTSSRGGVSISYIEINFEDGFTEISIKPDKRYQFEYNENESHTMIINNITDTYLEFILESEPINTNLFVTENKTYDLDLDGFNELKITLNGIYNNATKANLTLEKLIQPLPAPIMNKTKKIIEKEKNVTVEPKVVENKNASKQVNLPPNKKIMNVPIIILIGIIIIIMCVVYFQLKKKRKKIKKRKQKKK